MANLDELYIQIESDSSKAESAIDNLIRALDRLNNQLGLKDGSKLTRILDTLAKSSNSFTSSINGISGSGFEQVSRGAERASASIKQSTEQAEKLRDAFSRLSDSQINSGLVKALKKDLGEATQKGLVPEQPLALPMFEKMLPAVVATRDSVNDLFTSIEDVISDRTQIDAITQSFIEWRSQMQSVALAAEQTGASFDKWIIPEQGRNPSFARESVGWTSNIKPEVVEGYWYEIEDAANKCLPAIREVGTTALSVAGQFKPLEQTAKESFDSIKHSVDNSVESFKDFHFPDLGTGVPEETFKGVEQGAKQASSAIKQAFEDMRRFKEILSNMESGKMPFFEDMYIKYTKGYDEAAKKVDDFKKSISGGGEKPTAMSDVLENVVQLGNALGELSEKFGGIADKGINLFKMLTKPLQMVTHEYTEKFENMGKTVANFRKNFNAHMNKMSQFWKRTMKTFTFMVVRKAITAIIEEVNKAIQSMAKFSDAMGTQFNNSISSLVADFQYLGRSVLSVFAPLIDFIAPIIDAIVDRIALLLSYIGMLMAALTGASSFTKAKKNVGNYAKSLDSASKSAKNLTMGIDELNILAESSGGGGASPYDGWEDAWEEVDIPSWLKDMADWFKDLWDRFTAPLKEAWARAKQYVIDGFKTMMDSLGRLFGHVIDDFLTMWNEEKTIHMFEQIFRIVGDIFRVVRNLANQLDKAWQKGKVGLQIFRNLRDIMYELVEHARNVSYYMIGWADDIDFSPILESFETLTRKMVKLADFIGGAFEDIMIDGVLKYIEFMIEDAIPHLQETIAHILDVFNFEALRAKLKPLWGAIEEMLENIHTGTTTALGNLGEEIARFTNSKEFDDFLQRLVDITHLITAERVEKVLTGIGKGILAIGKAIVKFVNSKPFMAFLKALTDWIDNHSVDQIAGILEKIAWAIGIFKFGAFAADKLSGFFKFFAIIKSIQNLGTIAKGFTELGGGLASAGEGAGLLAGAGTGIAAVVGAIASMIAVFTEYKGVKDTIKDIADGSEVLGTNLFKIVAPLSLLAGFGQLLPGVLTAIAGAISGMLESTSDGLFSAILTEGETTVAQVKEWYSQATATIKENADKWKEIERNLTQDKGDLENYSQTLETLESALNSTVQQSTSAIDKLTGKYSDMTESINNYVDQSTDALAQELLENRDYYESKGKNVDEMIGKLYENAEKEKAVYNSTQEAVNKAAEEYSKAVDEVTKQAEKLYDKNSESYKEAVDSYVKNSDAVQSAYKTYQDAVDQHVKAIEKYRTETEKIDTSEAVTQIQNLGNSLDLSQYASFEDAATDIKGAIENINTSYESGLSEVENTLQTKLDMLKTQWQEGRIDWSTYKTGVDAAKSQYQEDVNTLTDTATQAIDFFDGQLASKLQDVQSNAEQEWENANPFKKFFMGSKEGYVQSQMQTYVEDVLGETGLTGAINNAYANLPGAVEPSQTQAITDIMQTAGEELSTWDKVINSDSLGDAFKTLFAEAGSGITDWASEKKTELSTWADGLGDDIPSKAKGFVEQLPQAFSENWSTVTDWFTNKKEEIGQNVENMLSEAPEKVGYSLGFVFGKLQDFRVDTMLWIAENVPQIIEDFGEKFAELKTKFWEKLKEAFDKLYEWKSLLNVFITTEIPVIIADFVKEFASLPEKMLSIGEDVVNGLIEGVKAKWDSSIEDVKQFCKGFVDGMRDGFRSHSPSEETKEVGEDVLAGLMLPFTEDKTSQLNIFVQAFINVFRTELSPSRFYEIGTSIIDGIIQPLSSSNSRFIAVITQIFGVVTQAIQENMQILGANMTGLMQMFSDTYLLPLFGLERWQPLFDNLMNTVFIPLFEIFRTWFTEEAMTVWWNEDLLFWFSADKWNEDIFNPLHEIFQENWDTFSAWWDTTLSAWWENQVKVWFRSELWEEQFNNVLKAADKVFELIKDAIKTKIEEAQKAVVDACEEMKNAIEEVMGAVDELIEKVGTIGGLGGTVSFNFGGKFANGGFPTEGSLFLAGEAGAEFVTNVGGRTGVVSNGEITGIADAVYSTGNQESTLLSELISVGRQMLDKDPVVIGDKDIARMANSGQSKLGMSIIS